MAEGNVQSQSTTSTQSTQTPVAAPVATPTQTPQVDLSVIPERFGGDLSKFVKSYSELEKRFHAENQNKNQNPNNNANPNSNEVKPLGARIEQQLISSGTIDEATMQEAINAGFSQNFLATQKQAIEAQRTAKKEALRPHSDGVEPDEVVKFFNSKLEKGEYTEDLMVALESSIRAGKLSLYKEIVADYKSASSKLPAPEKGTVSSYTGGFKDKAEYMKAVGDRRFQRGDKDYIAEVKSRFDNTADEIRKKW